MTATQEEILDAIAFYESRRWDWTSVVAFIGARAIGVWPPRPMVRSGPKVGRPRKVKGEDGGKS